MIRVAFWAGKLADVLDALAAAGTSAGVRPAVSGSAGAGILYACLDPGTEKEAAARFVGELRGELDLSGPPTSASRDPRGSVAVLAAPAPVLAAIEASGAACTGRSRRPP